MTAIADLQRQLFEAKLNHGPRKTILHKMKLLRALELMENPMDKDWSRQLALMEIIDCNAGWIAEHAKRLEAAARELPQIPAGAVGPVKELREAEQIVAVTAALLKSIRERYQESAIHLQAAE